MQTWAIFLGFVMVQFIAAAEFFQYQTRYSQALELVEKTEKLVRPMGSLVHGGGTRIMYFGDKEEWERILEVIGAMDQPVHVMKARLKMFGERLEKKTAYQVLLDLRANNRGGVGLGVSTMLNFRNERTSSSNQLQVLVNAGEPYAFELSRQTVEAISPFFVVEKDEGLWAEMILTHLEGRVRVEVKIRQDVGPDQARLFSTVDVPYAQWVPLYVNEGAINLFTEVFIDASEPHRL